MTRRWQLLEEVDDEYVDTGDTVECDVWQDAVELLLAVELCRIESRARIRTIIRVIGRAAGDERLRVDGGDYKVVPVASDVDLDEIALRVGIDANRLIDRLHGEGRGV